MFLDKCNIHYIHCLLTDNICLYCLRIFEIWNTQFSPLPWKIQPKFKAFPGISHNARTLIKCLQSNQHVKRAADKRVCRHIRLRASDWQHSSFSPIIHPQYSHSGQIKIRTLQIYVHTEGYCCNFTALF